MPSKNSRKVYLPETFYHVYNRGVNKQNIFNDNSDYAVFLNLFKRYLNNQPSSDTKGRQYPWLRKDVELVTFCLMPNHFHLLVYEITETGIRQLLKNVCGTYTTYFNKKYTRLGPLFQDRFKATMVMNDNYLQHISRYIHLNPDGYKSWEFSSLPYYLNRKTAEWINPKRVLEQFRSRGEYERFVADYEGYKKSLDELTGELANY